MIARRDTLTARAVTYPHLTMRFSQIRDRVSGGFAKQTYMNAAQPNW